MGMCADRAKCLSGAAEFIAPSLCKEGVTGLMHAAANACPSTKVTLSQIAACCHSLLGAQGERVS